MNSPVPSKYGVKRSRNSEGSIWEPILFIIFFVTVAFLFGSIANAQTSRSAQTGRSIRPAAAVQMQMGTTAPGNLSPVSSSASGPSSVMGSQISSRKKVRIKQESDFQFSSQLVLEATSSVDPDKERDHTGWYALKPVLVYAPYDITAAATIAYSQEYKYQRDDGDEGSFDDIKYGIKKSWKNKKHFRSALFDELSFGIGGFLPANSVSKRKSFQGSVGPRFGIAKSFGKFSVGQTFVYSRSFFVYEQAESEAYNSPDTYASVTGLTYKFTDKFSLNSVLEYAVLVDYQNIRHGAQKAVFSFDYAFVPQFGTSLGIATVRQTRSPDGQTESFKFYEKESTLAFLDLILSI